MSRPPAIHRIGPYAHAVDPRITHLVVTLEMHVVPVAGGDEVDWFPRVIDVTDTAGTSIDLHGRRMDGLAQLAWDVVEERVTGDKADTYRVAVATALVEPLEGVDW